MGTATALRIDPEFQALIPQIPRGDLAELVEGLKSDGCLDSIKTWDGTIVDGHNRYAICQEHGIEFKTTEMQFADRTEAKVWIIRNQFSRRNLKPFQRVELVLVLEPLLAEQAKERQKTGRSGDGLAGGRGNKNLPQIKGEGLGEEADVEDLVPIDEVQNRAKRSRRRSARTRETAYKLGKDSGVSHDTIQRVKVITEKASDAVKAKLREGETTINAVYSDLKRKEKEEKRETRRAENRKLIEASPAANDLMKAGAKFATITLDPPWDWGDEGDIDQMGRAKPTYDTMSFDDLKKLPVGDLADVDCHIYLWITNRSLPKGFALLDAWGFRYVTMLTWPKPSFGMGNYFRGQTEHVLFGVKGSQALRRKDASTLLPAWKRGPKGHSSKPVEFHEFVESCSPGPYLEMFARSKRPGWTAWGAEADIHETVPQQNESLFAAMNRGNGVSSRKAA